MDRTDRFDGSEKFDHEQYEGEVAQRWGAGDAYEASMQRTRRYGKDDWARIEEEKEDVLARVAALMAKGTPATGRAAMDLAEQHRCHIDRWFYPCSHGMHRNLAEMYTADPRFADYFEKRMRGLAAFLQKAIRANEARSSHRPGSHLST
ncbi:MAG: TipAS antibiotic-recognition domain-containing protein [Acidobacteria bacterium]|nr:TipAS antibiotic-recognition domain-containing protein [Acidobacteriota bacterium]